MARVDIWGEAHWAVVTAVRNVAIGAGARGWGVGQRTHLASPMGWRGEAGGGRGWLPWSVGIPSP